MIEYTIVANMWFIAALFIKPRGTSIVASCIGLLYMLIPIIIKWSL